MAGKVTKKGGLISLIGLGGGTLPFGWADVKAGVDCVNISNGGTLQDLREIIALVGRGEIKMQVQRYPFSKAFEALEDLRQGKVQGHAVLTFGEFDKLLTNELIRKVTWLSHIHCGAVVFLPITQVCLVKNKSVRNIFWTKRYI